MTPVLPSGGAHWIEPAGSGVSSTVRVIRLTETSAGVFEFDAGTGTAAELVELESGVFTVVPASLSASFVESPSGTLTPTSGTTGATPLIESPTDVFTLTPGTSASDAQLVELDQGVFQILPDSVHRATIYRVGDNVLFY